MEIDHILKRCIKRMCKSNINFREWIGNKNYEDLQQRQHLTDM